MNHHKGFTPSYTFRGISSTWISRHEPHPETDGLFETSSSPAMGLLNCQMWSVGDGGKQQIKDNLQKDNIQDKEDIILNEAVFFVTADKG